MFVIKIGGSVITDKSKQNFFKQKIMENIATEIKRANKKIILIHGAGSFGHILAKKYSLNNGYNNIDQIKGFSLTHAMVQNLNSLVLKELHDKDIPAISISPHSIFKLNNRNPTNVNLTIFKDYLDLGFTPLTFGDVVLDKELGFSICSGDLLLQVLSDYFKPEKVIFVLDEDGLYTSNPKKDKNAKFIERIDLRELENLTTKLDDHDDVTKGMEGKIQTIKKIGELGIDTIMLNGNINNRLYDTLMGKETKRTLILGGGQ
jgi:isopentenyl phosphate kinase